MEQIVLDYMSQHSNKSKCLIRTPMEKRALLHSGIETFEMMEFEQPLITPAECIAKP